MWKKLKRDEWLTVKISLSEHRTIKKLYKKGLSGIKIAKKYNVSDSIIYEIIKPSSKKYKYPYNKYSKNSFRKSGYSAQKRYIKRRYELCPSFRKKLIEYGKMRWKKNHPKTFNS